MQKVVDKTEKLDYNKDNKNKHRKKQNLRKGGTDHRERKFCLAFKTPLMKRLNTGQTQNRKINESKDYMILLKDMTRKYR